MLLITEVRRAFAAKSNLTGCFVTRQQTERLNPTQCRRSGEKHTLNKCHKPETSVSRNSSKCNLTPTTTGASEKLPRIRIPHKLLPSSIIFILSRHFVLNHGFNSLLL